MFKSIFVPRVRTLSRRDYRTQPGVLTPGTDRKGTRPEGGGREAFSVLECRTRSSTNFCRPCGAGPYCQCVLGLKPQAQSCSPFGTKNSIRSNYLSTFSTPHHTTPNFRARARARARAREGEGEGATPLCLPPQRRNHIGASNQNPFGLLIKGV